MSTSAIFTQEERDGVDALIASFDNHGCGMGLDIRAQAALHRLLETLDAANEKIDRYETEIVSLGGKIG